MIAWAQLPDTAVPPNEFDVAYGAVIVAMVIALSIVTVRWLLPLALRILLEPLRHTVDIAAACLLLPEYWLSTASRRFVGAPPYWAYEYGTAVSWVARLIHAILDRLFRGLDSVAGAVPFLVIAVAAGGITISQLMG